MPSDEVIARILLVEDDVKVARSLRKGLMEAGYVVTLCATAAEALRAIAGDVFDVVLLDLGLPDQDGLDVLAAMREDRLVTPVLILTARDAVDDRVTGLDAGADDYLAKPYAFNELLARVRALVRRSRAEKKSVLQVGDLTIDLINRRVERAGRPLDCTPREFDVVAYLANEGGAPVSRDTLTRDVWKVQSRSTSMDNVIDVQMARLRDKLDRDFDQRLLHTVRGVGYRLKGDL